MITTHVLDTTSGKPAAGVAVTLERGGAVIARGKTDADGRCPNLLHGERVPGVYRLTFDTAGYYGQTPTFYPSVTITFQVRDAGQHHHVPLLLSPWGYSTYRGS